MERDTGPRQHEPWAYARRKGWGFAPLFGRMMEGGTTRMLKQHNDGEDISKNERSSTQEFRGVDIMLIYYIVSHALRCPIVIVSICI